MINKPKISTRRIAFDAVFIAVYIALRMFSIPFGEAFRFTLAPIAVILCALLYGPVDGLLVGFLGEFIAQITGPYGFTPTTLLWCLGETARGLTLGLCAMLLLRKWLMDIQSPNVKRIAVVLICCILTGVLAALLQTFALYVDSKMFGYYKYEIVFGVLIWRILVYVLLSAAFGYLSVPIISALRKAKLV